MISNARAIAISQHRPAGVVFFEETAAYSRPVNGGQTAMQIFVEDFDQTTNPPAPGTTLYRYYTTSRTYLPRGIRVATLSDNSGGEGNAVAGAGNLNIVENSSATNVPTRAILFDGDGRLVTRGGLATYDPSGTVGQYPMAFGDWHFLFASNGKYAGGVAGVAASSPAFFLYNQSELDAKFPKGSTATATDRAYWLKQHSSIVLINANTGTVIVDRGNAR
jgi:hypothetical protein